MAINLEQQLSNVERELDKQIEAKADAIVIDALTAQRTTLRKKINAKAGRKATLADGTVVRIGDTVYDKGNIRDMRLYGATCAKYEIAEPDAKVVTAISPDGREIAFNQYHDRNSFSAAAHYFGTVESAKKALVADTKRELDGAEAYAKRATETVARKTEMLALVRADAEKSGAA